MAGSGRSSELAWAVGFVDVETSGRASAHAPGRPEATVGFGLRVNTPLGPLRGDIGFKLDRLTFANGSREPMRMRIWVSGSRFEVG
jgi:outer membrane protein assembly factor BamA